MEKTPATLADVRAWAIRSGIEVGSKGHLPQAVIAKYNQLHHKRVAASNNPWAGKRERATTAKETT